MKNFKHIRKDFNDYDYLNAFCIRCRSCPREMCDCDTVYELYLNGRYSGVVYMFYSDNRAFINLCEEIIRRESKK